MANYQHRLDAVEKMIAPRHSGVHVIMLDEGQTEDEALAAFAERLGLAARELGPVVYLSFVDAKL